MPGDEQTSVEWVTGYPVLEVSVDLTNWKKQTDTRTQSSSIAIPDRRQAHSKLKSLLRLWVSFPLSPRCACKLTIRESCKAAYMTNQINMRTSLESVT